MKPVQILIVDLGSQYTLVIARVLRELGYRSAVLSPKRAAQWIKDVAPKCAILSGGYNSVYDEGAPVPPKELLRMNVALLGICYGMQWIARECGGSVEPRRNAKQYGGVVIQPNRSDRLFRLLGERETVWTSHGDTVTRLPHGFSTIATSDGEIAAISCPQQGIWGVQFHPEVTHTPNGREILRAFVEDIAGCEKDWQPRHMVDEMRGKAQEEVGNRRAIIGVSGGVDSSTAAAILSPVFGNRLLGVTIDHGGLRAGDLADARENARAAGVRLRVVHAATRFRRAIGNATHGEVKRRRFKRAYASILVSEARAFGADLVVQGSLATDFIESAGHGEADLIKAHHNIGLSFAGLQELHPFHQFFKYEVRALAENLGLPPSITARHPFPGPGLWLRVNGRPVTPYFMTLLRLADRDARNIVEERGLNNTISQLVVSLPAGVRYVGVKGDKRVYGYAVVIRAVETADFMTAEGHRFPLEVKDEFERVLTQFPRIVAVLYNETDKPPCTTEPE